ncbi:MAG: helix-turn-helix transcriptional regulator [Oscillospiraceae bacterium]|jgi:transcriptional regulator with XRE-family HTH domain|nr:helix-turn-helix transcriptional regulator [Oscillospiraceae bacterium]
MFKNKTANGRNNISGIQVSILRKQRKLSQRALADKLQLEGIDLTKNAIQKMESGERFVTDIELKALAAVLETSVDSLV